MEELPKQRGSPDQSSNDEESDRQEQVKEDAATSSTTAPKRSYECTFCKRGFTNAQALGGHMNIHRKDRPKNKQPPSSGSSVSKASDEYMNPSSMAAGISSERASRYYPVFETRRNFHMYFPQSAGPNPPQQQQHGHYHGSDHFIVPPSPQSLILNEEGLRLGANLSLQIGSNNNIENSEMRTGFSKEDHEDEEELDLELRLGHDP